MKRPKPRPVDKSPKAEKGDQKHVKKDKRSKRPKPRPVDKSPTAEKGDQAHVKKYASGGVVRGAGAATRGKKFTRSC